MRRREEALLEREVLAKVGARSDLAIFKNEVGEGYYANIRPRLQDALRPFDPAAWRAVAEVLARSRVAYGLTPGSSDLIVVVGPHGRLACPELKSELGTLRPEQRIFRDRMRQLGVPAGEARSVADVERLIESARGGE